MSLVYLTFTCPPSVLHKPLRSLQQHAMCHMMCSPWHPMQLQNVSQVYTYSPHDIDTSCLS